MSNYSLENSPTFTLFVRPSFTEGMARVFDIGSSLQQYNYSKTEEDADYKAILSDWVAVGCDIRKAIKSHERRNTKGK